MTLWGIGSSYSSWAGALGGAVLFVDMLMSVIFSCVICARSAAATVSAVCYQLRHLPCFFQHVPWVSSVVSVFSVVSYMYTQFHQRFVFVFFVFVFVFVSAVFSAGSVVSAWLDYWCAVRSVELVISRAFQLYLSCCSRVLATTLLLFWVRSVVFLG